MSDSFFDRLPSKEREKIRKRLRSPEAYEALREKVKGPEDLEKELQRADQLAELHFALETQPQVREHVRSGLQEQIDIDVEQVVEHGREMSEGVRRALKEGRFTVRVGPHPATHEDCLLVEPEGNVGEALPVAARLSQQVASGLSRQERG